MVPFQDGEPQGRLNRWTLRANQHQKANTLMDAVLLKPTIVRWGLQGVDGFTVAS